MIYHIRLGVPFSRFITILDWLLESVYEAALAFELKKEGFQVKTQVALPVIYETEQLDLGFRIDIIVNELVIVNDL